MVRSVVCRAVWCSWAMACILGALLAQQAAFAQPHDHIPWTGSNLPPWGTTSNHFHSAPPLTYQPRHWHGQTPQSYVRHYGTSPYGIPGSCYDDWRPARGSGSYYGGPTIAVFGGGYVPYGLGWPYGTYGYGGLYGGGLHYGFPGAYGLGGYGPVPYGPYYGGWGPLAQANPGQTNPGVIPRHVLPPDQGGPGADDPAFMQAWNRAKANGGVWPPNGTAPRREIAPIIRVSTADQRIRSLDAQAAGDDALRTHRWVDAYKHYSNAIHLAEDRGEIHYRLGIAYAAMSRFDQAHQAFVRAIAVQPDYAQQLPALGQLLGPGEEVTRLSIISRATEWSKQDIRDPARLFVLGVLLHGERDPRAGELFQAARQLRGPSPTLDAFLAPAVSPPELAIPAAPADPAVGSVPRPRPFNSGPVAPSELPPEPLSEGVGTPLPFDPNAPSETELPSLTVPE